MREGNHTKIVLLVARHAAAAGAGFARPERPGALRQHARRAVFKPTRVRQPVVLQIDDEVEARVKKCIVV